MKAIATFSVSLFLLAASAHAETVTLVDGTKLTGEVVHSYKGEYTI